MRRDDSEGANNADQVVDAGPRLAAVMRERAPADAAPPPPVSIDGDTCNDGRTLAEILGCSRVTRQQARTREERLGNGVHAQVSGNLGMRRDDSEGADDADQVVDAGPRLAVVKGERAPADAAPPQPVSIDGDTYIDDRTLAKILGCSRVTLQQARTRGEGIPYVKIGRLVRYSTRTVREWLATHTRGSLPPGSAGANETKEIDGRGRR